MDNTLTLRTIVQRNENNHLANSLGDETILMNLENGNYLGINNVGTDIWNLLSTKMPVQDLINKLMKVYDVSEEECTNEVNLFLKSMLEQRMLIVNS